MDDRDRALRGNIWKLYLIHAGSGAMLSVAIVVPFFQENGLSLRDILVVQSIFALALILLEIPTGYLSDRWGRKNTIMTGAAFGFLAFLAYSLSSSFSGFVFAEILLAVGLSLYSGTLEAMTYDTLLELGETDNYRSISGNQFFFHFGAESLGGIVGGVLAAGISFRAPFWFNLIPFGIAVVTSLCLSEPNRHKLQETRHLKAMWDIVTHTVIRSVPLRSIILLHSVITTITLTMFWLSQPYQIEIGLPIVFFGLTHAVMVGSGAIASKTVHPLQKLVDDRLLLMGIASVVVLSAVTLGFLLSLWGLLFFLFARTAWGFLSPLTSDMVNRMTTSDVRATTLSIRPMGMRLLFALFSPLLGNLADARGVNLSLLLLGLAGGAVLLLIFPVMRRVWAEIPE